MKRNSLKMSSVLFLAKPTLSCELPGSGFAAKFAVHGTLGPSLLGVDLPFVSHLKCQGLCADTLPIARASCERLRLRLRCPLDDVSNPPICSHMSVTAERCTVLKYAPSLRNKPA